MSDAPSELRPPPPPPYREAGGVALAALVLYVLTLAPTTQFWDASEYITAAHALGIPHPPGNPFFVLVAHVWGLLPLGADYARRINLFAAATGAAAAGFWFLIGERWLRDVIAAPRWRRLTAAAGLAYVLTTDPRALLRPRFLVAAVLVAAVGTSVNLFIPIRAHLDPYLNQGDATNWEALRAVLNREQFGKPSVFDNPMYGPGADNPGRTIVLIGQQILNYIQYFSWQFGRDWPAGVQRALAVVFAALG